MKVLFVCEHNAGRSLAAEAIARHSRPDLRAASAGTSPSGTPNPLMMDALEERGIPAGGLRSKGLDEVGGLAGWDLVVTMGCLDQDCPAVPVGAAHQDWGLADPAADPEAIPALLDELATRVAAL